MKIHWNLSDESIPELSGLSSKERRKLRRKCAFKAYKHWQVWIALLICLVIVSLFQSFAQLLKLNLIGRLIIIAIGLSIGGRIWMGVWIEQMRPYLRKERDKKDNN